MGAFSSAWNASGQIPTRAVESGMISRFGAIDPLKGGTTSRYNFSIDYTYGEGTEQEFMVQGYSSWYNFDLLVPTLEPNEVLPDYSSNDNRDR